MAGVADYAPVASALGGVASSVIQNNAQAKLWREQREYNKPVNQVRRLREAGINPALALSQIGTGNADDLPAVDYSAASQGLESAGSILSQQELIRAQSRKVSAEADQEEYNVTLQEQRWINEQQKFIADLEKTRSDKSLSDSQREVNDQVLKQAKEELSDYLSTRPDRLAQVHSNAVKSYFDAAISETESKAKDLEYEFQKQMNPVRAKMMVAQLNNVLQDTILKKAQAALANSQAHSIDELLPVQKQSLIQGIYKSMSDQEYLAAQTDFTKAQQHILRDKANAEIIQGYIREFTNAAFDAGLLFLPGGQIAKSLRTLPVIKGFMQ